MLRAGGVVLHATEGVWGFACDPFNPSAVERILAIKGRAAEKGFIVIGADAHAFEHQLARVDEVRRREIISSWPGAHTWILPDEIYPPVIRGYRATLACRVPGHRQARALCRLFGATLVSTSANVAGEPAISSAQVAFSEFSAVVDFVLRGAVDNAGQVSTIHGEDGEILR